MSDKPEFTQRNVANKICEIKSLPDAERTEVARQVEEDIVSYIRFNFTLSPGQHYQLGIWPDSLRREASAGISIALKEDNWELLIQFPPPESSEDIESAKKKQHEQKVSGGVKVDPITGSTSYNVTKSWSVKWSKE